MVLSRGLKMDFTERVKLNYRDLEMLRLALKAKPFQIRLYIYSTSQFNFNFYKYLFNMLNGFVCCSSINQSFEYSYNTNCKTIVKEIPYGRRECVKEITTRP